MIGGGDKLNHGAVMRPGAGPVTRIFGGKVR